ncbi:uncharacterized protein BDW43DRAFT_307400 [Aspergillus alliaceus]|uniref:uncharacterized protein n=1 Tax=Petromyces alliaceus TaxID=209559 RepID=UPI0012A67EF7|nr:uncharacterized protein BDW43DRAFT_307400 [Aspergillus alliaceus]KAB8237116.1 hypothetical protein BDW43DRAFT_307400 [Aspergillus alliaceus]
MSSSTSNQKLVLLTGATGFIGFQTLLDALKAGFRVRCAVRSVEKGEALLSQPALQPLLQTPDNQQPLVEIAIVPDITVPGAFNEAILGSSYVIHGASPLRFTKPGPLDAEADFLAPARRGTLEILEAAATTTTVGRVVITSSVATFVSPKIWAGVERVDPNNPLTPKHRVPPPTPPFPHAGVAYVASKVASLEVTETFLKNNNPRFGVVSVHPSWVLGRAECAGNDPAALFNTTNSLVLSTVVQGNKSPYPSMMRAVVDVHDIARIQVQSLQQPDVVQPGHCRSFIASTPGTFEDIPGFIRKNFAEEIENGRVTVLGEQPSNPLPMDSSDTELTFGFKFMTLEEMTTDLVKQYIELKR